jgi:hypothetical protein
MHETTPDEVAPNCRWGTDPRHLKFTSLGCPHRPGNCRVLGQTKKRHSDQRQD